MKNKFFLYTINHPIKTILASVLISLCLAIGISQIEFKNSYRIFFSKENPDLQELDKFEKIYSKTDNVIFVIKSKSGNIFTRENLTLINDLTKQAWHLPNSFRVDSITNYQHSFAKNSDELVVTDLVNKDPKNLSNEELIAIKNIAINEPLLKNRMISQNGSTVGVAVTVRIEENDNKASTIITQKSRELLKEMQEKYKNDDLEIKISGMVPFNNAFTELSIHDSSTLVPLMFLFIILIITLLTRSFSATIITVIISAFAIVSGLGISGFVGIDMSSVTSCVPNVILTVAIADSIHILIIAINYMRDGVKKDEAILKSLQGNFKAILFTNITTIVGFLGLNFSEVPPFRDLGNMVSFGVLMCLIYSFTFLPALMSLLPMKIKAIPNYSKNEDRIAHKLSKYVIKNSVAISIITLVFTALMTVFIFTKIELNDRFIDYFSKKVEFRQDAEFMIDNLTGIYTGQYSVAAKNADGISEIEYLQNLEKFHLWLEAQPEIFHVNSIIDIYKKLNKNMNGDKNDYYKIPQNKELAAQYMLLYEMSLPYGLDLNDKINIDKSASRIDLIFDRNISTVEMRGFIEKAQIWQSQNLPQYMASKATGPNVLFAYISKRNIESMMKGNIMSILITCLLISFLFKSLKVGFISFIPNMMPILAAMGFWGLIIGQVNMAVAMISTITFGIIVDDTIHMLHKFFHAKDELKYDVEDAIAYAFKISGEAIFVTTVVLVGGFSILGFSNFAVNQYTGILSALVIGIALFYDMFGLPAMLNLIYNKKRKAKK